MSTKLLLKYVGISDLILVLVLLLILSRKRRLDDFRLFSFFLWCRFADDLVRVPLLFFRRELRIPISIGYPAFIYSSWIFDASLAVLHTLTIYGIYRLAMRPLQGLQRIGQIIFRWVAGVSFGLAVFFAISPHAGKDYYAIIMSQINQGTSVLALCLLLFVCLAIRPLGLTFRSHIFGVSLGLGICAATALIEAAWVPTPSGHDLYSPIFLISGTASLTALTLWIAYFVLPDPERRMVLLPTTSPFFMWNSISEALGDEPGFVAVSGFKPDMLSQAEIEALSESGRREEEEDDNDGTDDGPGVDGPGPTPNLPMPLHSFALNS